MDKSNWLSEEVIQRMYYQEGLGAVEIAKKLKKSYSQVYKFMKRHNFQRRSFAETMKLKFLRSPLSYSKKTLLNESEKRLHCAGLMLYWAEGSKRNKNVVDFANSDPQMCVKFIKMLRIIYCVSEKRLRVYLYCFPNQNTDDLIKFWSTTLEIPSTQFSKPYVQSIFDPKKTHKMSHGLAHIRYADSRLLAQIKEDIDIICAQLV